MRESEEVVNEFIAALERQSAIYEQMLEVSRRQKALGIDQLGESLELLLSEKVRLMEEIEAIEERISEKKKQWAEFRDSLSEEQRSRVSKSLERMAEILKTLISVEDENRGLLEKSKESVASGLRQIAGGRKLRNTYECRTVEDSKFIDTKE